MLQVNDAPIEGQTGTGPAKEQVKVFTSAKEAIENAGKAMFTFAETWKEVDRLSTEFVKNTGMGRERTIEMETSIAQSATEILKFSKGITTYEEALARSSKIIDEIAKNTSRSLIGNAKEVEGIAVAMEATNVPSAKLVTNFKQAGFALEKIPEEMKKVTDYTRSIGVNTAQVSTMVVDNLKNLNLYNFQNGIEGLTKMAAQSALFGVDMKRILTISEDMFDPEKAINMAASLQRLGVSTSALLDPLALMDMGQNNPAELQNQIVEMTKQFTYFDEKNKKFQILPGAQRQMREIGKELGIGADELARMALGSSELNKKMSEIRFPTLETGPMTEDQKQMIANMSEMRGGQYKVMVEQEDSEGNKTGKTVEKNITELTDKDIEILSKSGEKKPLEDIAKEQLSALNRIYNALMRNAIIPKAAIVGSSLGKAGRSTLYGGSSEAANSTENLLNQKGIQEFLENNTDIMNGIFEKVMKGEKPGEEDMVKIIAQFKAKGGGEMASTDDFLSTFNNMITTSLDKIKAINSKPADNTSQTQPQTQTPQTQSGSWMSQQGSAFDRAGQQPETIEEPNSSTSSNVSNLNNQTVNTTTNNNQQTSTDQYTYLIESLTKQQPQIVEHKFDGMITIKVDAPPGMDVAYVTKVVNDMVRSPSFTEEMMKKQETMANNYGLTGGKVSAYNNTSGNGFG